MNRGWQCQCMINPALLLCKSPSVQGRLRRWVDDVMYKILLCLRIFDWPTRDYLSSTALWHSYPPGAPAFFAQLSGYKISSKIFPGWTICDKDWHTHSSTNVRDEMFQFHVICWGHWEIMEWSLSLTRTMTGVHAILAKSKDWLPARSLFYEIMFLQEKKAERKGKGDCDIKANGEYVKVRAWQGIIMKKWKPAR